MTLRKMREEDLEGVMKWRMMPEVTKHMYTDPELTLESQKEWFKRIGDDLYWIIRHDGLDIGVISITNIDRVNRNCFWGYYIADTHSRGRGLARILECNIYDFVFDVLALNKLNGEVFASNTKVISIHEHFGSRKEGLFKEHIYKNGRFHDVVRMAILKTEWEKTKPNIEYERCDIEHDGDLDDQTNER